MNMINCCVYKNTNKIIISSSEEELVLSSSEREEINSCWEQSKKKNPSLFNGQVFNIRKCSLNDNCIDVKLDISNYAHYSYTLNREYSAKNPCRIVAVGGLIITSDNKILMGKMGKNTSFPGIIQCIGGGISKSDFRKGVLVPSLTLQREVSEELGIDEIGKYIDCRQNYIIVRKNMELLGIIFRIDIPLYSMQITELFSKFKKSKKYDGELENLVFVNNTKSGIEDFCYKSNHKVDYLTELLCDYGNIRSVPFITNENLFEI